MRDVSVALVVAGVAVGVVALAVLHLVPTGLSPVRSPVSQYGITRFRAGYRVQTIAYAVAGIGAAVGIATLTQPSTLVIAACCLFAGARAMISWYPMDVPGGEHTDAGRRHGLLAIAAFVGVSVAALGLWRMLQHRHSAPALVAVSGVLAVVMLCALVAMTLGRRSAGMYFGMFERFFYVGMTAWLVSVVVIVTSTPA